MGDHIHLLIAHPRTCAPSDLVKEIKTGSSKWLKTKSAKYADFHWQGGYGVFSISPAHRPAVGQYIGIRDIRSSERRFYQKGLDIYATSVDYTPDAEQSQRFFAAVQNKMHWATHGRTAAQVIAERADAEKPFMGQQATRAGGIVRKDDVGIAKNYLTEPQSHLELSNDPMNSNRSSIVVLMGMK